MDLITIRRASLADIEHLSVLFCLYRKFYSVGEDFDESKKFLKDRLLKNDSVIFLAFYDEVAIGFLQMFPSFSSIKLAKVYQLNDLYVISQFRRIKVGSGLISAAIRFSDSMNAARLTLFTQKMNTAAQIFYEKHGWEKNEEFYVYQINR